MAFIDKSYLQTQFTNFATRISMIFAKKEELPTKLSDLTNDGNFVTDASYVHTDNNYTTTEKNKLKNIASNAQVNIIESVSVNGTALDVNSKGVNITVPTKASDIGAMASTVTHLSGDVPTTRKVNGKALSADITLSASDVSAIPASEKGVANGVATLDANGKVTSSQLPSFVDDVIEGTMNSGATSFTKTGESTALTPESDKIYVDTTTNITYRWSGTKYVKIGSDLALGETSATAYRGDRGKIAYDHSQATHARTDATKVEASTTNGNIKINGTETTVYTHPTGTNPHGTTKSDVGLGNVGNFKAVSTVASQGLTDSEKANARANIGAGTSSFSGSYTDLTDKPTIPTVNNATLTIQKNGVNVTTFTSNSATNATANITVPTKVSDLTNDSGFTTNVGTITGIKMNGASKGTSGVVDLGTVITEHQDISGKADKATTLAGYGITDGVIKKALTSENLDSVKTPGLYYAGGTNTITNKPTDVDAFGLEVVQSASGWYTQIMYASNDQMKVYIRWFNSSSWTSWQDITIPEGAKFTDTTYSQATASALGLVKLYTSTGTSTDGTMTRKAITDALGGKSDSTHTHTKSDIGLGNVGNFKAVSTVANQGLTETEKANARANIGVGEDDGLTETKVQEIWDSIIGTIEEIDAVTVSSTEPANPVNNSTWIGIKE